ncbi:MAG: hypothetical protein ABJ310_21325, partial [Roseobacter sp.]
MLFLQLSDAKLEPVNSDFPNQEFFTVGKSPYAIFYEDCALCGSQNPGIYQLSTAVTGVDATPGEGAGVVKILWVCGARKGGCKRMVHGRVRRISAEVGTSTGRDFVAKIDEHDGNVECDSFALNIEWTEGNQADFDIAPTHDGKTQLYSAT